jgi:hypothetical protein
MFNVDWIGTRKYIFISEDEVFLLSFKLAL